MELQRGTEGVSEGSCAVRPETVAKQQEEALSRMLAVMADLCFSTWSQTAACCSSSISVL
jgi:hypothetical protein